MKDQLQSPSKNCGNLKEIENRIERYIPTVIGVFGSEKSVFYQEFFTVANYLRGEPLRFIHTFNTKLGKALGIKKEGGEAIIVKKPTVFLSDYEVKESKLIDVSWGVLGLGTTVACALPFTDSHVKYERKAACMQS